jgi:hypothetical protein
MGAAENESISAAQKELLKWHWKLGIGMYRIQEMMRKCHYVDPDGRTSSSNNSAEEFFSLELDCPTLLVVSISTRKDTLTKSLTFSAA